MLKTSNKGLCLFEKEYSTKTTLNTWQISEATPCSRFLPLLKCIDWRVAIINIERKDEN
jgi:hypothetical protein